MICWACCPVQAKSLHIFLAILMLMWMFFQNMKKVKTWRKQVMAPIRRTNMWSRFSRRAATFAENISSESLEWFSMIGAVEGLTIVARVGSRGRDTGLELGLQSFIRVRSTVQRILFLISTWIINDSILRRGEQHSRGISHCIGFNVFHGQNIKGQHQRHIQNLKKTLFKVKF